MHDPATLRTYADIFAAPRRQGRGGPLLPPSEACAAAALALRFMAEALDPQERSIDAGLRATAVHLDVQGTAVTVNRAKMKARMEIAVKDMLAIARGIEQ
jgi:hypothetical protein